MKQSRIDFIKEAHMAACKTWQARIEKEFPKIFKEEFKVGDWVILKQEYGTIARISEINKHMFWAEELLDPYFKVSFHKEELKNNHSPSVIKRKATPSEIESHLIAEAKRRGYKDGNYKCLDVPKRTHEGEIVEYIYRPKDDQFVARHNNPLGGCNVIYKQCQWAEIIDDTEQQMKQVADEIKEVLKKHGKNVDDLKKYL